jgi:hypothetical protein
MLTALSASAKSGETSPLVLCKGLGSVGDPEPDTDPHVFGPSGSIYYSEILPFSHKYVERIEIMLQIKF